MVETVVQQQQQNNTGTNGHVTALAIMQFAWGGFVALVGLMVAVLGSAVSTMMGKAFAQFGGEFWGTLGAALFIAIGLAIAIVGAIAIISGAGLMRYQPWGRIMTLIMATLAGLSALSSLVVLDILGFLIAGGFSAYAWVILTRPHIVALFHSGQQQQQTVVVRAA